MVDRDVVYGKVTNIQNCLRRIRDVTGLNPDRLDDIDVQDVFVLNLQRAVQSALDLAAHVIATEGLGQPASLRESFVLLHKTGIIDEPLAKSLAAMVGFRNIAVHEYQSLDPAMLKSILQYHLSDLEHFYSAVLKRFGLVP